MSPLTLRIRELRQAKGWNQETLAHKARTTQPVISRLEAGMSTRRLDVRLLDRIAKALGVDTADLIERPARRR